MNNEEIIKYQKKLASEVWYTLDNGVMNFKITGGAPRDWLHGNPATDIDVFIKYPGELTKDYFDHVVPDGYTLESRVGRDNLPAEYQKPEILNVWTYTKNGDLFKPKNTPIQFIELDYAKVPLSVMEYIEDEFNNDLNKYVYCPMFPNGGIACVVHEDYLKTGVVVHSTNEKNKKEKIDKVVLKYPNYKHQLDDGTKLTPMYPEKVPNAFFKEKPWVQYGNAFQEVLNF
jgi:hypothetical protein